MIKLKSLLPLNEFKSFNDKSRNMDTIRIKNKREHQRIMKTLDKWKTRYRVPDPAKGAYHIQFYNTKEAMMHRRRLEKAGFKIIDPNNEGKLTEASYKFIKGKYLQTPSGEITSIPGENERDAIILTYAGHNISVYKDKGKIYIQSNKWDKYLKDGKELAKWLTKMKYKYLGIDNR